MIWQDTNTSGTSREKIADRLLTDVPTLCGNTALASHPTLAEAAQGVALYLDQIEVIPEELDPRQSRELLAHALDAAGEGALARRIRLFGNRVIYPATWIACGRETVWVLDTRQLMTSRDAGMEMIFFDRIRIVLATFADVWDATSGRGFLGLKGMELSASIILGPGTSGRALRALTLELRSLAARHLEHFCTQRGWDVAPAILTLLP
ncbi:MAG: hypothetical protein WCI03_03305 [bacterium]|jgi:hypothetical protein